MKRESGFLSAALGLLVLTIFVSVLLMPKMLSQNSSVNSNPTLDLSAQDPVIANKQIASSPTPYTSPIQTVPSSASPNPNAIFPSGSPATLQESSPAPDSTHTGRFIKITSPNGGEVLTIGENLSISWEYKDLTQCLITYVLEDGTKSSLFIPVAPEKKTYQLPILSDYFGSLDQIKLKVEMSCYGSDNNYVGDQSDGFFTVKK